MDDHNDDRAKAEADRQPQDLKRRQQREQREQREKLEKLERVRAGRREVEAMIDAVLSEQERRIILVDGFNVLHSVLLKQEREAGWWRRVQRERLLQRVSLWPLHADQIWVAFDGAQPAWSVWAEPVAKIVEPRLTPVIPDTPGESGSGKESGGTSGSASGNPSGSASGSRSERPLHTAAARPIVHSVYVESADDWIVRRARRAPDPERTIIVSADRQVTGRARSAGCEVWSPWSFMSRCPHA
jgi:rRNA-processing protein FCF1